MIFYSIQGGHNGKMVKLVAFSMEDCGYKWCVHRQMVCNDNIFVFNVKFFDAFRWDVCLSPILPGGRGPNGLK